MNKQRYIYRLFDLGIHSDFEIPALYRADLPANLTIEWGDIPQDLHNNLYQNLHFQANEHEIIFSVLGVGRYWLQNGEKITIQSFPNAEHSDITLFLRENMLYTLLFQRKMTLFQGCAVNTPEGAVVFLGRSGIGKSLTAYGLHQYGYDILADDICVLDIQGQSTYLLPDYPRLSLWRQGANFFGIDTNNLRPVRKHIDRYHIPITNQAEYHAPIPIRKIYILTYSAQQEIVQHEIHGSDIVRVLWNHSFRTPFLDRFDYGNRQLLNIVKLARHIPITILSRPFYPPQIENVLAACLSELE